QADRHLVVQRRRQALLVRPHDRQAPHDRLAVMRLSRSSKTNVVCPSGTRSACAAIGNSARFSSSFHPWSAAGTTSSTRSSRVFDTITSSSFSITGSPAVAVGGPVIGILGIRTTRAAAKQQVAVVVFK